MLGVLGGLGGLAPELLAADPEGEYCGEPAIVTSRLPGRASVTPEDPYDFAGQLGRALARIHAHPGTGLREVLAAPPTDAGLIAAQVLGAWGRLSGAPQVLTHYDYWSGNTLWRAGQLTGVVDWSAAGLAPSGFDVSWCRLDLVLLFDRAIADTFTTAYEAVSGASCQTWACGTCPQRRTRIAASRAGRRTTRAWAVRTSGPPCCASASRTGRSS